MFSLEQWEYKAKHCGNVLGRVLGQKTRYKIGPLVFLISALHTANVYRDLKGLYFAYFVLLIVEQIIL